MLDLIALTCIAGLPLGLQGLRDVARDTPQQPARRRFLRGRAQGATA